jgi:hypothetical protein
MSPCVIPLLTIALVSNPCDTPKEGFWTWLARVSGISANPSTLMSDPGEPEHGDVFLANLETKTFNHRLTTDGRFRSPGWQPGLRHAGRCRQPVAPALKA